MAEEPGAPQQDKQRSRVHYTEDTSDVRLLVAQAHQQLGHLPLGSNTTTVSRPTEGRTLAGPSLLCHCLWLPRNTPAQKALDFTLNNIPKTREDRPRTCLLSTRRADWKRAAAYPCHKQRQRRRDNRAHTLSGYSITA